MLLIAQPTKLTAQHKTALHYLMNECVGVDNLSFLSDVIAGNYGFDFRPDTIFVLPPPFPKPSEDLVEADYAPTGPEIPLKVERGLLMAKTKEGWLVIGMDDARHFYPNAYEHLKMSHVKHFNEIERTRALVIAQGLKKQKIH